MPRGIDADICLGNPSVRVDKKGVASGKFHHSKIGERTISPAHFTICIGEQFEVQSFFRTEFSVRVDTVHAHSQDNGVTLGVPGLIHLKVVSFARATRRLILRIEVKDDPTLSVILQANERTFLRSQSEVGRAVARLWSSGARE